MRPPSAATVFDAEQKKEIAALRVTIVQSQEQVAEQRKQIEELTAAVQKVSATGAKVRLAADQ
jgi:uncharacterized coiled-coil protein SlyX